MKKSINKIMKKEHQKIDALVRNFEKASDKTTKDSQYLFNKLGWAIKEHFFMEEKIIFSVHNLDIGTNENSELVDDHDEALSILRIMEDKKLLDIDNEITKLIGILKSHSKLEEDIFYDKLDNSLSESQREDIINRADKFLKR